MTGEDLIRAIRNNNTLMGLNDCPSVPVQMSCAVYGKVQNDIGNDVIKRTDKNMNEKSIRHLYFLVRTRRQLSGTLVRDQKFITLSLFLGTSSQFLRG